MEERARSPEAKKSAMEATNGSYPMTEFLNCLEKQAYRSKFSQNKIPNNKNGQGSKEKTMENTPQQISTQMADRNKIRSQDQTTTCKLLITGILPKKEQDLKKENEQVT